MALGAIRSQFLKKWLIKNNCLKNKRNNVENISTHLSLAGGNYHIPNHKYNDFLKVLEKLFETNDNFYISENRTEIFRFIIDIDYMDELEMSPGMLNKILKTIYDTLVELFKLNNINNDLSFFVLKTNKTKNITKENDILKKTGVHIYFKDIFVDSETAIKFRSCIIQNLINKFGERPSYNTWDDIIDAAIYKQAGLRMPGAHKPSKCPECKGKDFDNCSNSCERGYINEERPYLLHTYFNTDFEKDEEKTNEYRKNYLKLLQDTSLRTKLDLPNINFKDNIPDWIDKELYKNQNKLKKPKKKSKTRSITNEKRFDNSIERNSTLFNLIETTIVNSLNLYSEQHHCNYTFDRENLEITHIKYSETPKRKKRSFLIGTTLKFCFNVKREHNSNNTYFVINDFGLMTRCHSESRCEESGVQCSSMNTKICDIPLQLKNRFNLDEESFGKLIVKEKEQFVEPVEQPTQTSTKKRRKRRVPTADMF